jgi:NAD-dependent dihydropyrimidine dehydrogenase PreA subunit
MMVYLKNVVSLQLNSELCTGCGRCLEVCPHEVFRKAENVVEVQNRDRCIECGACMLNCPAEAIMVDTGVGCAAAVLNGMLRKSEPSCDCDTTGCC